MMNKELVYLTTTETLYPKQTDFDSLVVRLYGRTKDQEMKTVTVKGFQPYFLTRKCDSDKVGESDHEDILGYEEVTETPLSERWQTDQTDLVKVNVKFPHSVKVLRQEFDRTWEADCIFTERFRIDTGIKTGVKVPTHTTRGDHIIVDADELEPVAMKDVEPRVLTLDIETDDRDAGFPDPGEARILSIAIHDSYTDQYEVFLDLDGENFRSFFDLNAVQKAKLAENDLSLSDIGITEPDKLTPKKSEQMMLTAFANTVQEINPDLIAGWNSGDSSNDGFDMPHIISRMKGVGASAGRLSREREVEVDHHGDDFKPSVTGRALYDLMDGWGDTKFTEPDSFKLDDVAQDALGDAKIEHQEQGYFEMYDEDPVKFVNYNVKDTRLTVEVNQAENVLGFKKRLKDMVGVDWRRTHQNNEFIEMSVRRKCAEHGLAMITAYDNEYVGGDTDEVNYEGAYVFSPFEGLRENVVGIDLESLYPRTQQMLNVSPDARIEKSKALVEDIPFVEAENGQTFRDDVDGIMRELITDYMKLKAKFKEERNEANPGTEEREKLAEVYSVTKTIVNSFYGYGGWNRSPLYNPHDAAAVTLTGQAVIKATAEYVNDETSGEVAYGDTDSVYCQWPNKWGQVKTLEYVDEVCDYLNEELYPDLCEEYRIEPQDNRWNMELEKRGDMFMSGSKKRYSMRTVWSEGMPFNKVIINE
jgi:DNA polymerase I